MNYKQLKLLAKLPYEVKYTLIEAWDNTRAYNGVPRNDEFVKFATNILKKGLYLPD